jgi:hypothetical protein
MGLAILDYAGEQDGDEAKPQSAIEILVSDVLNERGESAARSGKGRMS